MRVVSCLLLSACVADVPCELRPSAGGTVAEGAPLVLAATVDDGALTHRFQIGLGAFVLILMPIVIGGVVAALWHLVAPSEKPPVRWQAVQVVQIVHVLWPPFMIYFIWRRLHTQAGNAAANLTTMASAAASNRQ